MNIKSYNKQEKNHYNIYLGFIKFAQISAAFIVVILILMANKQILLLKSHIIQHQKKRIG